MLFEKFFESKDALAVHCPCEKDAELLLAMFDDAGYKWFGGQPYSLDTHWYYYTKNTCYLNNHRYAGLHHLTNGTKVFSFREFLAEEFMSVLQTLKSLNLRGVLADYNYILLINDALDAYAEFKEGGEI